jgi:zinc protease
LVKQTQFDVSEHRFGNGLLALLLESHDTPVVCLSVWYRAGSRHDPAGMSGMAHLLEHMMFKGTQRHPKGDYDRMLHVQGATNNASTWLDRTNYYVLIGSDRYRVALELEADRMRGALLSQTDLDAEMTVVRNELERGEDDPVTALFDRLHAVAFLQHPYRRPVIGWREDIESITAADLKAFYDRHYQPNHAFLVVAGDFDRTEMSDAIGRTFGAIPAPEASAGRDARGIPEEHGTRQTPGEHRAAEPPQQGERRFELRKAGRQELLALAYKIPHRKYEDSYALDVLAQVLGHGRTSRLYKRLVESGLTVDVAAENQAMPADPYLFYIEAELARGVDVARVAEAIAEECRRLCREPISSEELERACKRARVDFVMRRDSVSARAFLIGEFEVTTGRRFVDSYLERLGAVTPEQVMQVATKYLVREERTVGHFRPR